MEIRGRSLVVRSKEDTWKLTVMTHNYRIMIGLKNKSLEENLEAQAEISFRAGIVEERERIKHAICFNGHLVTTKYGHGYHVQDKLWLELFPKAAEVIDE